MTLFPLSVKTFLRNDRFSFDFFLIIYNLFIG